VVSRLQDKESSLNDFHRSVGRAKFSISNQQRAHIVTKDALKNEVKIAAG
jgi:hypothetical protein